MSTQFLGAVMTQQVNAAHYDFSRYVNERRWMSYYYQLRELVFTKPINVLEIGPGDRTFTTLLKQRGIDVTTLDHTADVRPDVVGSVTNIPFRSSTFDSVCAFQVLEHLPFEQLPEALYEINRVSKRYIFLSIPHAGRFFSLKMGVGKRLSIAFGSTLPRFFPREHSFDGEHHWEIGKKKYEQRTIDELINRNMYVYKMFRPIENPYHQFYCCVKGGE